MAFKETRGRKKKAVKKDSVITFRAKSEIKEKLVETYGSIQKAMEKAVDLLLGNRSEGKPEKAAKRPASLSLAKRMKDGTGR